MIVCACNDGRLPDVPPLPGDVGSTRPWPGDVVAPLHRGLT